MSVLDTTQLALTRAISGATLRNAVLANNIANAGTPGYQPSDVDFHSALAAPLALRADGNGVDPEAESAKLAENGLELSALVQVAGARAQILRTAMGVS